MPVFLDRDLRGRNGWRAPVEFHEPAAKAIDIAVVNNMPDAALELTERQFTNLLDLASGDMAVRLSFYALADVPRNPAGQCYVESSYSSIENLWNRQHDALIVTGTDPRAPNLEDEPYWQSLISVIKWADHNTTSTILSCLSAHAAVLHFDGVRRQRLADKCFGLFECTRVSEHALIAGAPSRFPMPQSRWNEVREAELARCGYQILTRAGNAGADTFVKQRNALFVFFQGHPEYDTNSLLLEYRRDVCRYVRRERENYPETPAGYFDRDSEEVLAAFRNRVIDAKREELLAEFPTARVEANLANKWRPAAVNIYRNWLKYLWAEKERQRRKGVRHSVIKLAAS
jgi:homoserine O-succinyltransferase